MSYLFLMKQKSVTIKYKFNAFGHNFKNMTKEELINELSKVEDKTMEVNFPYSHGTQENGQPLNVDSVSVFDDCVVIY